MLKRLKLCVSLLFTLVFLLIWFGIVAFWIRSKKYQDVAAFETETSLAVKAPSKPRELSRLYLLISSGGGICIGIRQWDRPAERPAIDSTWQSDTGASYPRPWLGSTLPTTRFAGAAPGGYFTVDSLPPETPPPDGTISFVSEQLVTGTRATAGTLELEEQSPQLVTFKGGDVVVYAEISAYLGMPASPKPPTGDFSFLAYRVAGRVRPENWSGVLIFPYWSAALVVSVPAMTSFFLSFRLVRGSHRNKQGCCGQCGYDLRGSPQRCPECGTTNALFKDLATAGPSGAAV